mgnify:CR=1 FL=1|tara:strand:+ start:2814 stop:5477 length:2664 start_codon:yes stop_codon:yes gene_type:complete
MKNKYIYYFIVVLCCIFIPLDILAENFIFKGTEVQVSEDGNRYKGINGGSVTTDNNLEITSDNFEYDKLTNILEAHGNVIIYDSSEDITLYAEDVFYYKNEEKVYTVGKTKVVIEGEESTYKIDTSDLFLFRNKNILSSSKKTSMKDDFNNFYLFDNFIFLVNDEIVKGDKIVIRNEITDLVKDEYNFETGFFNLKTRKFLGKDITIKFNNELYGNKENEPRLKGTSGDGDEFNTYVENAVFTSCKQDGDECPPWVIEAERVRHDKKKRSIIYKNAWLKVYDIPVVYFPKFFHPDPTVRRQSGFLDPSIYETETLGASFRLPYFYVISESTDLTFKPRIYDSNKYVLHNELRKITKNSYSIMDFSFANGYRSDAQEGRTSMSHVLFKSSYNLTDELVETDYTGNLQFQYEKTSNDIYLSLFELYELEDELKPSSLSTSSSFVKLVLDHADYSFDASMLMFESLGGLHSDRYSYSFPNYYYTRGLYALEDYGFLNFNSGGSSSLGQTNVVATTLTNTVDFTTYNKYSDMGIKSNIYFNLKNYNDIGKNHATYETSPQSELWSAAMFNSSFPLKKRNKNYTSTLNPKASIMFSPHEMRNERGLGRSVTVDSLFNLGRLGLSSYEEGASLTLGVDYKVEEIKLEQEDLEKERVLADEKRQDEIEKYLILGNKNKVQEIELEQKVENTRREKEDKKLAEEATKRFFELKLGGVIRPEFQQNLPINSTLNNTTSNLLGKASYNLSKYFKIGYDFSLDNDLSTLEYNSIDTTVELKKLIATFNYTEENGKRGNTNTIASSYTYNFNDSSKFSFKTRRNRKISLTEYYKLVYEYQNDCLRASLRFNKKFYSDGEIRPSESLLFTLSIVPLTTFDQSNILKHAEKLKDSLKNDPK